ncbi:hypothetical protein [Staphylococcus pseudoxylosus]|uniref:hypothetical protein n=1 Tax=Staphylococcus pseudoxylosus TaxID=2282419 RepID=UPI002DBA8360|nr:hypothetical protein [Staphylococcus pseudoxylosus]MEB6046017.1 hypothetical protein [Staphylococcus pseudoxylosus]
MGLISLGEEIKKLRSECNQYKAENDTLIDNLAVLKANISRLERENEELFLSEVDLQEKVNRCLEEVVKVTD